MRQAASTGYHAGGHARRGQLGRPGPHLTPIEHYLLVEQGALLVTMGDEAYDLGEGDAFYFMGDLPPASTTSARGRRATSASAMAIANRAQQRAISRGHAALCAPSATRRPFAHHTRAPSDGPR